jgi:hypothetical protein
MMVYIGLKHKLYNYIYVYLYWKSIDWTSTDWTSIDWTSNFIILTQRRTTQRRSL